LATEIREAELHDIPALVELLGELFTHERDFMPALRDRAKGFGYFLR
jgi:N-acetylglutamate synthase-like GNAT family acetyltransferase